MDAIHSFKGAIVLLRDLQDCKAKIGAICYKSWCPLYFFSSSGETCFFCCRDLEEVSSYILWSRDLCAEWITLSTAPASGRGQESYGVNNVPYQW